MADVSPSVAVNSQAAGAAQILKARLASCDAVLQDIQTAIDPASQSITLQACTDDLAIVGNVEAANNSSIAGASNATIDAAILAVLNMTATPNNNQWKGAYSNPWNDPFIAMNNAILQFFATYDLTS